MSSKVAASSSGNSYVVDGRLEQSGVEQLPDEIWMQVLGHLSASDLASFSQSCRNGHRLVHDRQFLDRVHICQAMTPAQLIRAILEGQGRGSLNTEEALRDLSEKLMKPFTRTTLPCTYLDTLIAGMPDTASIADTLRKLKLDSLDATEQARAAYLAILANGAPVLSALIDNGWDPNEELLIPEESELRQLIAVAGHSRISSIAQYHLRRGQNSLDSLAKSPEDTLTLAGFVLTVAVGPFLPALLGRAVTELLCAATLLLPDQGLDLTSTACATARDLLTLASLLLAMLEFSIIFFIATGNKNDWRTFGTSLARLGEQGLGALSHRQLLASNTPLKGITRHVSPEVISAPGWLHDQLFAPDHSRVRRFYLAGKKILPTCLAASQGQQHALQALLKAQARQFIAVPGNPDVCAKLSALMEAANERHLGCVLDLLDHGANPRQRVNYSNLHSCTYHLMEPSETDPEQRPDNWLIARHFAGTFEVLNALNQAVDPND